MFIFLQKSHFSKNQSFKSHSASEKSLLCVRERLNPYPWIFGTINERVFWKKSRIIAGDITVETLKMKIVCANLVSVRLYFDVFQMAYANSERKICRAEQKYMPFSGPSKCHQHHRDFSQRFKDVWKSSCTSDKMKRRNPGGKSGFSIK